MSIPTDMADDPTFAQNVGNFQRHLEAAGRALAMRINHIASRPEIMNKRDREELQALLVIIEPLDLAQDEWNAMVGAGDDDDSKG